MKQSAYCLFATPLGKCGIAWRPSPDPENPFAVISFQLPEATVEMTKARIAKFSGAPEPNRPPIQIKKTISKVCLHLQGEVQDFGDVLVDLEGAEPFVQNGLRCRSQNSSRKDRDLWRHCQSHRHASQNASCGMGLGQKPDPSDHPLPSSRRRPWQARWIFRLRRPSDQSEAAGHRRRRCQSLFGINR